MISYAIYAVLFMVLTVVGEELARLGFQMRAYVLGAVTVLVTVFAASMTVLSVIMFLRSIGVLP